MVALQSARLCGAPGNVATAAHSRTDDRDICEIRERARRYVVCVRHLRQLRIVYGRYVSVAGVSEPIFLERGLDEISVLRVRRLLGFGESAREGRDSRDRDCRVACTPPETRREFREVLKKLALALARAADTLVGTDRKLRSERFRRLRRG